MEPASSLVHVRAAAAAPAAAIAAVGNWKQVAAAAPLAIGSLRSLSPQTSTTPIYT
jgi:hypothetical protein